MRNLASIQKIKALEPISGADSIEKATILGWNVVVKKGDFQVGDLCVYCEIDSLFPNTEDFDFLKPRGMRIRTIRLRGQVSQGICFPFDIVKNYGLIPTELSEGQDITEALGIIKYEPPIPAELAGLVKGNFPSFIPKTDETRVQVLQDLLDAYIGTPCYVAEKLDGSSVTYFIKDGIFGVCSRNLELLETENNTLWKVARTLQIEEKLRSLNKDCALQGELIGEGIQGNKYKLKGQTAIFFNFFDIQNYAYASFEALKNILSALKLSMVPVIDAHFHLINDIEALVALSQMRSQLNPQTWCEGIVIRPLEEMNEVAYSKGLLHQNRVSFKVINPEFLIKYNE
ncbi:MAG: RNA ligase (ATP) [Chitinophagales bacterium]|nr:RNA ligase (ATP) [Chitinophagales bacterium]